MNLCVNKAKNGVWTLYVHKKFRDENGKSTTKVVERLGTYEELSKLHDDPIVWAKEYIAKLNEEEKESRRTVIIPYSPVKSIEKGKKLTYEIGYLFLQKLYYELRLDYICKKISKKYAFQYDLNDVLSTLIFGRVLFPTSKMGTYEYAKKMLEKPSFELQDIYRALEVIAKEKDYIQTALYKFSKGISERNDHVLYYDCTNYYFEIERESGMRKYGISKEHRPNPIVQMGLFMDADGIPLAFCIGDGNANEQTTLQPLEKLIIDDFGQTKLIVCTDAGLSSNANRKFNDVADRGFITTQSIKKMKGFQKEWAMSPEGWILGSGDVKHNLNDILESEDQINKFKDSIFYKERWFNENGIEQRYIVTFSIKSRIYQRTIRNEQISRATQALERSDSIEKTRQTDYKRFIVRQPITQNGEVAKRIVYSLDEAKIANEEQYDGFYAVATNLDYKACEVIKINRGRWEIEESFRIMKNEFKARPVYLSRDDRITAHFVTCFLALVVFRFMEKRLKYKYTCEQIIDGLKDMRILALPGEGYTPAYMRTDLTDAFHEAFGFKTDLEIITSLNMRKILSLTKTK